MLLIEILKGVLYGIVEGITEWLPVSSTGHLILLEEFLGLNIGENIHPEFQKQFWEMFQVVIQLGAILAVIILYFQRLNPLSTKKNPVEKKNAWMLLWKIVIASMPAAVIGLGLDAVLKLTTGKDMDAWLYNAWVVAAMLIIYGVAFILVEKIGQRREKARVESVNDISWKMALGIGTFQAISIIPGTSRSGATILGSMLLGLSRPAAAEFSFFMAIPAMLGASFLKALGFFLYVAENSIAVPYESWIVLAVASLVAFAVSMVAIRFLIEFVRKHSFAPFGWYRIALGVLVLGYFGVRAFMG